MSRLADLPPPSRTAAAPARVAALLLVSLGLVLLTGVLGPSAAVLTLPQRRRWMPPYWFDARPSPWLVTALLLAALLLGAAGLLLGLRALAEGWRPSARRLRAYGALAALAMVLVPPMGSADVLVYAAYGRIAATGGDPYATTAAELAASGDPVGRAVEAPWQHVPSVYGPLATLEQALAARIGGGSTHATVAVLLLAGALAYVATGELLARLAADEPARARAALLWSLNPLLLATVVNPGHVDALAVALAVAALVASRRSTAGAGALVGAACAVKLTFGLYVLALAWACRRQPRRLVTLLLAAAAVGALAYLSVGWHALDQVRASSRLVSFAAPWRLVTPALEAVLGAGPARVVVALAAAAAGAALTWLLARALPAPVLSVRLPEPTASAVRAAAALTLAWTLTAPYTLPWYDALAWAPLVLLPPSVFDRWLVARTTVLALAYVPGRVTPLPGALSVLTRTLRGALAPVLGLAVVAGVVRAALVGRRPRRPAPRRPPGTLPGAAPRRR